MSTTTVFDIAIRMLECCQCGAPVAAPSAGGQVSCTYCGAVNAVAVRKHDAGDRPPPSMADEVARLSRLQSQLQQPLAGHAYDLSRLPLGWSPEMLSGSRGVDRLEYEWKMAKSRAGSAATHEEQRGLWWMAMRLADNKQAASQPMQARAALETSLDILSDAGHRHLVRCRLASEAVREGDLASAEGWLSECDSAPEVLELDTAYREALARLRVAQNDPRAALSILGARPGDVPVHPSAQVATHELRVHVLEALGHEREADRALEELSALVTEEVALESLAAAGFAPGAVARRRRARLRALDHKRNSIHTGISTVSWSLVKLPVLALILFVVVTIPRCACDADPLMGANGYLLCPEVCPDCHGPFRIHTVWTSTGDGESTDGPQYFCPSTKNGIDSMSDDELESIMWRGDVGGYELFFAPAATTFLFFMLLLAPFIPVGAYGRHAKHVRERAALTAEIRALASALGEPEPPEKRRIRWQGLLVSILIAGGSAAVAFLVTMLELTRFR